MNATWMQQPARQGADGAAMGSMVSMKIRTALIDAKAIFSSGQDGK
jgi:hypothetical protein